MTRAICEVREVLMTAKIVFVASLTAFWMSTSKYGRRSVAAGETERSQLVLFSMAASRTNGFAGVAIRFVAAERATVRKHAAKIGIAVRMRYAVIACFGGMRAEG